jgi:hypothetical protein
METSKIKIKIGQHEFEAEGPTEAVQSQFQAFKDLIAGLPMQKNDTPATSSEQGKRPENQEQTKQGGTLNLDRIMRVEGRIISLTARAESENDAVLLLMLGQKNYRSNETVTGNEIMEGLQLSGIRVPRVDRIMDKLATDGMVIRIGAHRATRYRFTNQGVTKALELANAVAYTVA